MLDAFNEHSIFWLLLTSVVSLIIALITSLFSSTVTTYFSFIASVGQERQKRHHDENLKWANPVIGAVRSIRSRLDNVISDDGYEALSLQYNNTVNNSNWSIDYAYFLSSTLYLFGHYFAWSQMVREEISYELFRSKQEKKTMFDFFWGVTSALSQWDITYEIEAKSKITNYSQKDCQVFVLQQRAIAELFIIREKDQKPYCISYPEFMKKMIDPTFATYLQPLKKLLDNLEKDTFRWYRLECARKKLSDLEIECERMFF